MAAHPDGPLTLSVFGPLRLRRGGRALPLATRKVQALLLWLRLEGGGTRERLCDLLWPALDEHSARRNLRRELARLRDAGAAEALQAEGDHLRADPALHCDLLAAEAALARGDADPAWAEPAGELADGLTLADAPAFAFWLAGARDRALRLRLRALEAGCDAAQARGDAAGALRWLQALLALDGLQERHHRSAMRLLAASGQREAALQQYERCQRLLAEELGLKPMPETEALAQALRNDPAPAVAAAPGPTDAWPAELPFVGREPEVARLQQAFAAGRALLLVGEAGVGKTRLATDFASAQGALALVRCQPGDAELPFGAFARALRVLAGQPPDLRGLDAWAVAELVRLLPELGAPPPALRNEGERLRFDEACLQAWSALTRGAFDCVVLDDWHLADAGSRTLLARAAARRREAGPGGAIEILAWRGTAADPALRAQAEALGAELLALGPLEAPAVHALVRQLSGAADPAHFARRLGGATGGHPYFIAETLRDLAERGLLARDPQGRWRTPFDDTTADYRELPLSASVRDAVLARVERLDAAAARLLEAAALAGEPFGAAWLASACALSEAEALQALERAAQAQLVQSHPDGGYGWVHDLARQALDSALAATRRRLVHHRLALAADSLGDVAAAARHFEACGEATRAAPHRRRAGDAAHALQALAAAAAQWRQGLADRPTPADELALRGRLCETCWVLGLPDEAADHYARLQVLLAEATPGSVEHGDALLRGARYMMYSGQGDAALAQLESMPQPVAPPLRHRWINTRIGALQHRGRLDEAVAEGQRALRATPELSGERAELLVSVGLIELQSGRYAAAIERGTAALALYGRLQDDIGRARALYQRGCSHLEMGELAAGGADLRAAATLAGGLGHVYFQRLALYNLATLHSNQTRPDAALAVAQEAWPGVARDPGSEIALMFRTLFVECHHMRGEWGALWDHLEPAVDRALAAPAPMILAGVANVAVEPAAALGRWDRVQPLVQALEASGAFASMPGTAEIMLGCAQAALIRHDLAAAEHWLDRAAATRDDEQVRVQCRLAVLRAQLRVAVGDGRLDGLPADAAPGMNAELRLRVLALRCAAAPTPALRRQARAALADPQSHAGAALWLAQVLGPAALAEQLERHAGALAGRPALLAGMRATWTA